MTVNQAEFDEYIKLNWPRAKQYIQQFDLGQPVVECLKTTTEDQKKGDIDHTIAFLVFDYFQDS